MFEILAVNSIISNRPHNNLRDAILHDDETSTMSPFTDVVMRRDNIEDVRNFIQHLPTRHSSTGELKREVSEFYNEVGKHFDHEQRDGLFDRESCHFEVHVHFYLHAKDAEFTDPPISVHVSVMVSKNEEAGYRNGVEKSVKYYTGHTDVTV